LETLKQQQKYTTGDAAVQKKKQKRQRTRTNGCGSGSGGPIYILSLGWAPPLVLSLVWPRQNVSARPVKNIKQPATLSCLV
jgi:hypothetical protein